MNTQVAIENGEPQTVETVAATPEFTKLGMKPFKILTQEFEELHEILADLEALGGEKVERRVRRMEIELDMFAPAVTFIGQIKSGKTTLVNALAGQPGLLPADVNPWTSVVTSVHLGHLRGEDDPVASFTFFDESEWDHLIEHGGRIGELSARAGAEKEHERLVAQVNMMREKTKARLGRKFEMLLGQTHNYNSISDDLIQRYVCLGDDFEDTAKMNRQGQFADITKEAELHFPSSNLPMPLTLRDTPGMNDTFLMREQITISAIRESRVAVVVLSAHQALNSVDMGLIRLISNVKSREVVIFINRIDELEDPVAEVPEIRNSLLKTLKDNNGPQDVFTLFGSAYWANHALEDKLDELPEASKKAMDSYEAMFRSENFQAMDERTRAWVLSGAPQLFSAIGDRVAEAPAQKALTRVRRRASNILEGMRASSSIVSIQANSANVQKMSSVEVRNIIDQIAMQSKGKLDTVLNDLFAKFSNRVDQANERYIERALDDLIKHLENHGEDGVWSYSADGLRSLMRTSYQVMSSRFRKQVTQVFDETADELTAAYGKIFDVSHENFRVTPPPVPELPAPVGLAQTIILDVGTSTWKRWWAKRKGYQAYAADFRKLIEAETETMLEDLKVRQIEHARKAAVGLMVDFLTDQSNVLSDMSDNTNLGENDLNDLFGVTSQAEREYMFDIIAEELGVGLEDEEEESSDE